MPKHTTDEDTVECPICGEEFKKRGLFMHIYSTDDSPGRGHHNRGNVPHGLDIEKVETSGTEEVQMDYPDTQDIGDAQYFDTYTGKAYKGKRGIMVHLGQAKGENNIPSDVTDRFDADDFPIVETDEDGNITNVVKWGSDEVPPIEPYLPWYDNSDIGYVRRKKIRKFIQEIKSNNEEITPDEVKEKLLG